MWNLLIVLVVISWLIRVFCVLFICGLCFFYSRLRKLYDKEKRGKDVDKKNNESVRESRILQFLCNIGDGAEIIISKKISKIPIQKLRPYLLKCILCVDLGKKVVIYDGLEVRNGFRLHIGDGTIVGNNCILDARNVLYIGNNVNISSNVSVWTEEHDVNDEEFSCNKTRLKMVEIRDRVWLSNQSIVLPGTSIGEGTIVAAGAVVTKSFGDFLVVAGVPAEKIGTRNRNLKYNFDGTYVWFI